MSLEKLDADLRREWAEHPCTLALLKDLKQEIERRRDGLETVLATTTVYREQGVLAGLRAVVDTIRIGVAKP